MRFREAFPNITAVPRSKIHPQRKVLWRPIWGQPWSAVQSEPPAVAPVAASTRKGPLADHEPKASVLHKTNAQTRLRKSQCEPQLLQNRHTTVTAEAGRRDARSKHPLSGRGKRSLAGYAGLVGLLAVDVSHFGVVMSADSQPIEALAGKTRVLAQQGGLTRCPIVSRNEGRFAGFTGYVGTEEIDGSTTRDWLIAFGSRHAAVRLADYATALGRELTAVWKDLGLQSVLEILISGVENGDVRFWYVRNSQGLNDDDWTYKPPKQDFDVVDDLDGRYMPRDLQPGQTKEELLGERTYSFRQGVLLPAAPVFDAFSQILAMLYAHGVDGFEPVGSLDDLAYFARQRLEFLKRLSSKKHGIYTKSPAPLGGEVHVLGVDRNGVMKAYPKIRAQAKAI